MGGTTNNTHSKSKRDILLVNFRLTIDPGNDGVKGNEKLWDIGVKGGGFNGLGVFS